MTILTRLIDCHCELMAASHGNKHQVIQKYLLEFGWRDKKKLYREMQKLHLSLNPRGQRSDSGQCSLTVFEAEEILRWQQENARSKGLKTMVILKNAVETLRANGIIKAQSIDPETGEIKLLSLSAIRYAMQRYGLNHAVLNTPPPAIRMRVEHPNQVWQIDASLCVLYYLSTEGLQIMEAAAFNKNKPRNFKKIEHDRVWRYTVVDVASHCIYVEYVFGGESGVNLTSVFIHAMQQRNHEFYGVPKRVYCDAGSANTGAIFKSLCQNLGIDLQWHLPGNARATGSVEKAQHLVEIHFESMLASRPVKNLDELNEKAALWRTRFNATRIHTRHGMPRYTAWTKFVEGHLKLPPSEAICRQLVHTKPIERKINANLSIHFEGKEWDASNYPKVYRGKKVFIIQNPWDDNCIRIIDTSGSKGDKTMYDCPLKQKDRLGYDQDAPIMGEQFARHAATAIDRVRSKLLERSNQQNKDIKDIKDIKDTKVKLKKPMPFGGKVDPYLPILEAKMPLTIVPKHENQKHENQNQIVEKIHIVHPIMMTCLEAYRRIKDQIPETEGELYMKIRSEFPNGHVPEEWVVSFIDNVTHIKANHHAA